MATCTTLPFCDLTTELLLEALSDNIRSTFAYKVVCGDSDMDKYQDWVDYCHDIIEDINVIDEYVGSKLFQMPTHIAPQMARLILNLGRMVRDIMRACDVEFDIMNTNNRNVFLLDMDRRVNQLMS